MKNFEGLGTLMRPSHAPLAKAMLLCASGMGNS